MTRTEALELAASAGWKLWGKPRAYGGGVYQTLRKGNAYARIGNRYVERSGKGSALDLVIDGGKDALLAFLADPPEPLQHVPLPNQTSFLDDETPARGQ